MLQSYGKINPKKIFLVIKLVIHLHKQSTPTMLATMKELNRSERIERALDGRKQSYIIKQMNELLPEGKKMTDDKFSRKKRGYGVFTEEELAALSQILGQDITN